MLENSKFESKVIDNFTNVKLGLLIPPFLLLTLFFLFFLTSEETSFVREYVECQKELFYYLNSTLSVYPNFEFNITQLGDALIFFSLIIIFLFYIPKLWEVLLTSSIITLLVSAALKRLFAVPRPAAVFDVDSFVIIGRTLKGHTSLPSGHCITSFMVITLLLYAFMPKKTPYKIIWSFLILTLGFIIAFSRVGVGAHYPFDVIIGSAIGYIAAIIGIKINKNFRWLDWIKNKKFHPIFMLLLLIWAFFIIQKILAENLLIFYMSLMSLGVTLFLITKAYVKKS